MFCTTLRRRPSYAPVLSSLIAAEGLKLRENKLDTHDVAIPLAAPPISTTSNTITTRQLRVLLLSPSTVSDASLAATLDRIHRFAALTGGQDLAIVFLLNPPKTSTFTSAKVLTSNNSSSELATEGVLAYAKLQAVLLPRRDIPHIPILPLASVGTLPDLLKKHATALSRKAEPSQNVTPSSFDMLQLCTTEPPMDRQTAFFTTDCFASVRELALACTEPLGEVTSSSPFDATPLSTMSQASFDGRYGYSQTTVRDSFAQGRLRHLRGLVGEQRYGELVEFWTDEWVVE